MRRLRPLLWLLLLGREAAASGCQPLNPQQAFISNPRPTQTPGQVAIDLTNVVPGAPAAALTATVKWLPSAPHQLEALSASDQVLSRVADFVPFLGTVTPSTDSVHVTVGVHSTTVKTSRATPIVGFASVELNRTYVIARFAGGWFVYIEQLDASVPLSIMLPLVGMPPDVNISSSSSGVLVSATQQAAALPASSASVPCVDYVWLYLGDATAGDPTSACAPYLGTNGFARDGQFVAPAADAAGAWSGLAVRPLGCDTPTAVTLFSAAELAGFVTQFGLSDPCGSSPCQNGGVCNTSWTTRNFTCLCAWGYSGRLCEIRGATNESVVSNIDIQVTVALRSEQFTWQQFVGVVANVLGVDAGDILPVAEEASPNQTIVQFQLANATNVQVMRRQQQLTAMLLAGHPELTQPLPVVASRLIAHDFQEVPPGFPAWLIVGIVFMVLFSLVNLYLEW